MTDTVSPRPLPLVLVVDDDPSIRLLFREVLALAGFAVAEAATRAEAMESFAARTPDSVLLDLAIEGEDDGYEICATMRALAGDRPPPIVVVSGRIEDDSEARALAAGASGFLAKPVDFERLVAHVRALVSKGR